MPRLLPTPTPTPSVSPTDVSSQVYCGPFLLQKLQKDSEILVVKNPNYYNADKVVLNSIKWVYDDGENPNATYNDVVKGVYAGMGLTQASGTLDLAKADGNFDKYAYVSETTSTSYFGGLNLNRGTFALESGACASPKTEQQKADTVTALNNKNFRKAMQFAWDKGSQNATSRGEDLKTPTCATCTPTPSSSPCLLTPPLTATPSPPAPSTARWFSTIWTRPACPSTSLTAWTAGTTPRCAKAYLEAAKEELGDTVT